MSVDRCRGLLKPDLGPEWHFAAIGRPEQVLTGVALAAVAV